MDAAAAAWARIIALPSRPRKVRNTCLLSITCVTQETQSITALIPPLTARAVSHSVAGGFKSMRVSGGDDPSEDAQSQAQAALQRAIDTKAAVDGLDSAFGFDAHEAGERVGWLFNVCAVRFAVHAVASLVLLLCLGLVKFGLVFSLHVLNGINIQDALIHSSAR